MGGQFATPVTAYRDQGQAFGFRRIPQREQVPGYMVMDGTDDLIEHRVQY